MRLYNQTIVRHNRPPPNSTIPSKGYLRCTAYDFSLVLLLSTFPTTSMRYCWLLVAWATISNALVVLYPPPNSNMPIGIPFSVTWETSISAPYRQLINIYLLSSPSPTDVVQVLQTNVNTVMNGCSVTVSQVQPNNYYLYLNDTNVDEGNKVVGPFYFTLSVTTAPAMPSASSAVSPSASSGPPKFPVWIIPIIIVLILAVRPFTRFFYS